MAGRIFSRGAETNGLPLEGGRLSGTVSGRPPVTDAAPTAVRISGAPAWPGASTNVTGGIIDVASGIGRRIITIVDYSLLDNGADTVTIITNGNTVALDGTSVVLTAVTGTPGAGEFKVETDNATTAGNLAAAINANANLKKTLQAVAVSDVVRLFPLHNCLAINLATNAAVGELTVTSSADGAGLRIWGGDETSAPSAISHDIVSMNVVPPMSQRVLGSPAMQLATGAITSDRAYFTYVGQTLRAITPKHVEFWVTTGGVGAQTVEVGLFSTPLPPNKANQTVTKLTATGTVDDVTTTGVKRNTSAFTTEIAAGTHLWAGARFAMATTQPNCTAHGVTTPDGFSEGFLLTTAAAGALTAAGPWTGSATASLHILLRVTLD